MTLFDLHCEGCGGGNVMCVRPGSDPLPALARSPNGMTTVVCQLVLSQRDMAWCFACSAKRGWLLSNALIAALLLPLNWKDRPDD